MEERCSHIFVIFSQTHLSGMLLFIHRKIQRNAVVKLKYKKQFLLTSFLIQSLEDFSAWVFSGRNTFLWRDSEKERSGTGIGGAVLIDDIHDKIKDLREEKHFKQRQVAEFLGISQQAYSYYELDKRELPARHVVNLAKLYQVSTDYLLGLESSPSGSYDVNASFIHGVSLKEVMVSLGQLSKDNRQELIKYLSYLNSTQGKQDSSKKDSE